MQRAASEARATKADSGARSTSDVDATASRRSFTRACAVGALLGTIVFIWMITRGTFDLFQWQRVGYFYDAQAHSLLAGHLSIDPKILGIEAFKIGGSSYIYQGPVPALLRLPIIAILGDRVDGRLTQLSMIIALVVAVVFACRLHWKVRTYVRGAAPVERSEALLVGLFTFVLAGGSCLVYEASRAWVYDEALLWGAAFCLASIDTLVSFIQRPSRARLAASSTFAACALLTRASVGIGPVVGLGLVAIGALAHDLRTRRQSRGASPDLETGATRRDPLRLLVWLAPHDEDGARPHPGAWLVSAAAAAPMALYAIVNYAKFGRLFSVPFYAQYFSQIDPGRKQFLTANSGTLFGLQFIPTTFVHYFQPDALRFTSLFPFVGFPPFPGHVIGTVQFDLIDRSSSLPSSQTFLFFLAVGGLVALFRRAAWHSTPELHPIRVATIAAAAAAAALLPFGYIANRYLADFAPVLTIAGAVGLQMLLRHRLGGSSRWWVRSSIVALIPLALFTTWVNIALAVQYQREWSYNIDASVIAGYIGFQRDVNDVLGGQPIHVGRGTTLPNGVGHPGALFAIGNCDALYVSDGLANNSAKKSPWNAVERTRRAGHFVLRATFPRRPVGTRVPIFTNGPPGSPNILYAEYRPGDEILFGFTPSSSEPTRYVGFPVDFDRQHTIDIVADWRTVALSVRLDDVVVLDFGYTYKGSDFRIGRNSGVRGVAARFPGRLEPQAVGAPLCRALLRDERG